MKVLALSFLLLIGVALVGEGLGMHIPKGYIYFAMGFSVFVEVINLRVRRVAGVAVEKLSRDRCFMGRKCHARTVRPLAGYSSTMKAPRTEALSSEEQEIRLDDQQLWPPEL